LHRPVLVLRTLVLAVLVILSTVARSDLIMSAPPREGQSAGQDFYGPLAEYLSRSTGEKVVYRHPDNWAIYQALMTKGEYDLIFDGPHFVSWRIANLKHLPVASLDGNLSFVVVVRKNEKHIRKIEDLAGQRVCGHAPPNLATLTLFDAFTNPARQPRLVETRGFDAAYRGLLSGKCNGTVLPVEIYRKLDERAGRAIVIRTSDPLPNQALTAGPRVSQSVLEKLRHALTTSEGKSHTTPIAERFGARQFIEASADQYKDHARLLRNVWGFEKK